METKAIKAVNEKINQILNDRDKEISALAEQVKSESNTIKAAEGEMTAATIAGDVKAYQKAKAKRTNACDAKEMHEKRVEMLNKKPLITETEYNLMVSDVASEMSELDNNAKEKLAELSNEMNAIGLELKEAQEDANEVLKKLKVRVFDNATPADIRSGKYSVNRAKPRTVDKWETIWWATSGVNTDGYKKHTGNGV